MSHKSLLAITLVLLVHTALAVEMDPFADPAHDPQNPQKYIPNHTWALIATGCYGFVVVASLAWSFKYRAAYMITLMISAAIYAGGCYMRIVFAKDPHTLNKFIPMHSAIVLSPCGFIATESIIQVYMLLGRLTRHLHAEDLLLLRPNIITKVYVTSDILTLLMQATGGGMGATDSQTMRDLGAKIFLAGFIAQCVSFVSYLFIFALFVHRMRTWRAPQWDSRPNGQFLHWTTLMWAIALCCAMITIRTAYRTVEAAQGLEGYLATHEPYFYGLDCIPLWIGILAFVIVWPPKYLVFNAKSTGRADSQLELRTPLYSRV
ncbi:hypothetical protein FRC12_004830 [Ceratobasidium sp. 428]|nr:hypothetical protein FRC12_004830 [Ceratobasidium sp. 428]